MQVVDTAHATAPRDWRRVVLDLAMSGRPGVSVSAGVAAAAAASFGGAGIDLALRSGIVAMLGAMVCMVINDLYDVNKDRLARVTRAIAAGRLTRREGAAWAAALTAAALLITPRSPPALAMAAGAIAAGIGYSAFAHAFPALKGFYTAACCCLPLVYGAAVAGAHAAALVLVSVALFNVGRETFLDAHHAEGDAAFGQRTLGILLGAQRARRWGIATMCVALAIGFLAVTSVTGRIAMAAALLLLVVPVFVLRADDESLRHWSRAVLAVGGLAAATTVA